MGEKRVFSALPPLLPSSAQCMTNNNWFKFFIFFPHSFKDPKGEKKTFFWNICHFGTFFHKGTLKTAKWAPGICCPQEIVSPPLQTRDAWMWEGSAGTSGRQKTVKSQRTPMAAKTTGKVRAGAITPSCPGQFPPFFQSEARPLTHVPTETTHKDSEMLPTQHRAALTARTAIS